MAASYLYDAYTVQRLGGARLSAARLERVERQFLQQSGPHLAHYWEQSTDEERMFFAAVSLLSQARGRVSAVAADEVRSI